MTMFATDDARAPRTRRRPKENPFETKTPLARCTVTSLQKQSTRRRAGVRPSPPAHDAFDPELAYGDAHRRVLAVDAPEPVRARAEAGAREVHRPANAKRERVARRASVEPLFAFFSRLRVARLAVSRRAFKNAERDLREIKLEPAGGDERAARLGAD